MKKAFLIFLFLIFTNPVFADTTVFGMTIGKTTEAEVKKMHTTEFFGVNKYVDGNMYYIRSTNLLEDKNLKELSVIFNEKGVLVLITATLPRANQAEIFGALSKKYKLVSNIKSPGGSSAGFIDGETEISMLALQWIPEMKVRYSHKSYWENYRKIEKEEGMKETKQTKPAP